MKKKFAQTLAAVLMVSAALLTSCKSNNKPENKIQAETKEVKYLDATAYNKWVFFSLKDNKVVETSTPDKDKSWDIAFRRELIAVNAPEHYSGKGGIVRTDEKNFDATPKTSGLKFVQNSGEEKLTESMMSSDNPKKAVMYFAHDMVTKKVTRRGKEVEIQVNRIAGYDIHMANMGTDKPMYTPVEELYIVRGADGKTLYKVQFTGAVNAQGKLGGTLSFRYKELR